MSRLNVGNIPEGFPEGIGGESGGKEPIEELRLGLDQPIPGELERYPFGSVDFRKGLALARMGWPLDLEPVAENVSDRNILHFHRPDPNPLPTRLLDLAQIEPLSFGDR